jgi:FKBP-type peptidyl-prolyl cis-trans isomerase/protein-disulfide isomerase
MQYAKSFIVSALPVLSLSLGLACKPSGATPVETPMTTIASTTAPPTADPLATWVADHMGPDRFLVPYSSADLQRGAQDNALVTVVVFTDYGFVPQRELNGHLEQLLAAHGDELLVVIKPVTRDNDPTGKVAALAVLAAAEQDRGWEMHELLIEGKGVSTPEEAHSHAAQIGVPDLARFDAALERSATATLHANVDLAQRLGINIHPFMFVNGAAYTHVVSFDDLSGIHAAERELAVGLVKAGAQAQDVYWTIMKSAPFEREPAITYRRPFDGTLPSNSKTLANDIVIEDFVLGEGEPVRENTLITYNFRGYSTIDPRQFMGSRANVSKLLVSELGRQQDPIARATIDALLGMQPGGKRRVRIPAAITELAKLVVPSDGAAVGDLILTVELVSVGPAPVLAGLDAFTGKPLRSQKSRNKLEIHDYAEGEGEGAKQGDVVALHYIGHLADGTKFDDSHGRGNELEVTLGGKQVIPGFDLGLEGVKAGMLRKIVIPPKLGYGDEPRGPIPAGSTLTFYVQVMSVSSAEPSAELEAE